MNCDERKELREKMPRYGAYAGAALATYLLSSKKFPHWNPVSKFAESMTVGYLGGFLLAPIVARKCDLGELTEEAALLAPPTLGAYGSYATAKDAAAYVLRKDEAACGPKPPTPTVNEWLKGSDDDPYPQWMLCARRRRQEERKRRSKGGFWSKVVPSVFGSGELPEGCADWSGVCASEAVYNTIDGSKCPQSQATLWSMTHTTYSCPEWYSDAPIRKGPLEVYRRHIGSRRAADPCSGIPRTINNCPPGATCAVGPSLNPEYRACIEAAQEVQKESKGIPTWVFLAAGAGVGLLLARK